MKTGHIYGVVTCSKTRVRCVFCGVYIPKANKCIEQHTNGAKHKEKIELMNENGIYLSNDILHCKPCNCNLPEDESVTKHIESKDHAKWMNLVDDLIDGEFITLDAFLSCEKDEGFCKVCNSSMICSPQSIKEHVDHINHRANITRYLKPHNGIFPVDNEDKVWCKVCDTCIDNTVQSILSHIDGDPQHVQWFDEIEELIENQEVTIDAYLTIEHENSAYCSKCKMQVTCNSQSIESHVYSDAHLNQIGFNAPYVPTNMYIAI